MSQLKLTADSGGGTVAIKGPASTAGNAAIELTVPGTANGTILTSNSSTGKTLKVFQAIKTDTASTGSTSFADILTVSITPSATRSKILYTGHLYLGFSGAEGNFRLTRTVGGSTTEIGNASVVDDDADGYFAIGGGSAYTPGTFSFLDSPNTTSAITYGIKWHMHSGTMYLNRTWDNNWFHVSSTITAMEVAV